MIWLVPRGDVVQMSHHCDGNNQPEKSAGCSGLGPQCFVRSAGRSTEANSTAIGPWRNRQAAVSVPSPDWSNLESSFSTRFWSRWSRLVFRGPVLARPAGGVPESHARWTSTGHGAPCRMSGPTPLERPGAAPRLRLRAM